MTMVAGALDDLRGERCVGGRWDCGICDDGIGGSSGSGELSTCSSGSGESQLSTGGERIRAGGLKGRGVFWGVARGVGRREFGASRAKLDSELEGVSDAFSAGSSSSSSSILVTGGRAAVVFPPFGIGTGDADESEGRLSCL